MGCHHLSPTRCVPEERRLQRARSLPVLNPGQGLRKWSPSLHHHRAFRSSLARSLSPPSVGFGGCSRDGWRRSEEHTSELQSRGHLVCRLLLEKKKQTT